jgi:hypothetical protein
VSTSFESIVEQMLKADSILGVFQVGSSNGETFDIEIAVLNKKDAAGVETWFQHPRSETLH